MICGVCKKEIHSDDEIYRASDMASHYECYKIVNWIKENPITAKEILDGLDNR